MQSQTKSKNGQQEIIRVIEEESVKGHSSQT